MTNSKKTNLILLPGLDGTGILFNDLVDQLGENFQIERVSYPSTVRCSLEELAQLVKDRMTDPQNTLILAESFSGLVGLTLLRELPVPPKGIIFSACFVIPPLKALLRVVKNIPIRQIPWGYIPHAIFRKFCLGNSATKEQVENLKQVLSEVDPRGIFQRLGLIESFDIPDISEKFKTPCVYFQAINDRLIANDAAIWFSRNFEPFSLEKIPGPHFLLQTQAKLCAKSILAFDKYIER